MKTAKPVEPEARAAVGVTIKPMASRLNQRPGRAVVVVLAISAMAGCSGERGYDAEGVVSDLNAVGAGLVLGESLPSIDEDVEVRVVGFAGAKSSGPGVEEAAGAVVILGDADQARAEFTRCESAISFVCFRAANTVLRFTGLDRARTRSLAASLAAIESSPDG